MRRSIAFGIVAAAIAGMAAVPAHAAHCDSQTVIFSRTEAQRAAGTGTANPNAVVCTADPDDEFADTRVLLPAASQVKVRFAVAAPLAGVASLNATLSGLGFDGLLVQLTPSIDPNLGFNGYNHPIYLDIPAGAGTAGAITAVISKPDGTIIDSVCFHTVDGTC